MNIWYGEDMMQWIDNSNGIFIRSIDVPVFILGHNV